MMDTLMTQIVASAHNIAVWFGAGSRQPNKRRRQLLPRLDNVVRRPLTRDKSKHDDEHVITLFEADLAQVEQALQEAGYERDALATLKFKEYPDGRNYEVSSMAKHDGRDQWHCYIFAYGNSLHLYHHKEWSYLDDWQKHWQADKYQIAGDPDGTLMEAVDGL